MWRFALAVMFVACNRNECELGDQSYCENNTAYNCSGPDDAPGAHNRWLPTTCESPTVCVAPEGAAALCAASSDPGGCAGIVGMHNICDSAGTLLTCQDGYPTMIGPTCGAQYCMPDIPGCLAFPDKQLECASRTGNPEQLGHYCSGDMAYSCFDGYAFDAVDCGPGLCHDTGIDAACVMSTTPDARCVAPDDEVGFAYSLCDVSTAVITSCIEADLVGITSCRPTFTTCTFTENLAVCED